MIQTLTSIAQDAPKVVSIDLETTGLDWTREKELVMGVYGGPEEDPYSATLVFGDYTPSQLTAFFEDFTKHRSFILQNAKFDFHFIKKFCSVYELTFADTMILAQLIDERTRHSLDALATRFFGKNATVRKKAVDEYSKKNKCKSWHQIPLQLLSDRAEEDSENTFKLYHVLRPQMYSNSIYDLEKKVLMVLFRMEENGTLLDIPYLHTLKEKYEKRIAEIETKYPDINLMSPNQVRELLFNGDVEPPKYTSKGNISVDMSVLKTIDTPFAKDVVEYRNLVHTLSTFIAGPIQRADANGRIHCNFKQLGARTGRLSCVDPNLQQIPVTEEIRRAFIGQISLFDYSQMEAILYVIMSKAEYLYEVLSEGTDLYQYFGSVLYEKLLAEVSSADRDFCKGLFLGKIYGLGETKFRKMTKGIPSERVNALFANLDDYHKHTRALIGARGYTQTAYGRRRHLTDDEAYKGVNAIIQGTAADIIKIAMTELPIELQDKLRMQIHDELVSEGLTREERQYQVEIMRRFDPLLKIKAGTGDNWWAAKEASVVV